MAAGPTPSWSTGSVSTGRTSVANNVTQKPPIASSSPASTRVPPGLRAQFSVNQYSASVPRPSLSKTDSTMPHQAAEPAHV